MLWSRKYYKSSRHGWFNFWFFCVFFMQRSFDEHKITIAIAIVISGIWICRQASEILDSHDHPSIVWDEMASMYCLLLFVPNEITSWMIIFILFRLFDIWKPWPISWFDSKITGGLGIMVDDLIAGLFALGCFNIIYLFF